MKKILLTNSFIMLFCACSYSQPNKNIATQNMTVQPITNADTVQVQDAQKTLLLSVVARYEADSINYIQINNIQSGKRLQTIEKVYSCPINFLCEDINFDGSPDLVFFDENLSHNSTYEIYLWNASQKRFIYYMKKDVVAHITTIPEKKLVVMQYYAGSAVGGFSFYRFVDGKLQCVRQTDYNWHKLKDTLYSYEEIRYDIMQNDAITNRTKIKFKDDAEYDKNREKLLKWRVEGL